MTFPHLPILILHYPFSFFLLTRHLYHRHNHFLKAYAAMLKCIAVIVHIIIVIIRIAKETVFFSKNERRVYRGHRQSRISGVTESQYFFLFIVQVAAMFVPQVGSGLLVTNNLIGRFYPDAAMVCSQYHPDIFISNFSRPGAEANVQTSLL